MKKTLLAATTMSLALLLGACGETTVEKVDKEETATATEETTETDAAETTKNEVFAIGDTVNVNDVEITITKAEFTDPAEYSESANGKILTLDVDVNNTSDEQTFVSDTDFGLSLGDTQADDYYSYDEMALSADLNKGKKKSGKLYYDVEESDTYELIYTPSFSFDDTEVKWDIKVK